jgi:hypothetical protein
MVGLLSGFMGVGEMQRGKAPVSMTITIIGHLAGMHHRGRLVDIGIE